MRKLAAIALAAGLAVSSLDAEAEPVRDHGFYIAVVTLGAIGGVGNSIGALVYAIDGRSFHSAWIVSSLFSSAVCGAMAGQLIVDAANGEGNQALVITGIVGFIVMSAWPAAWVMRSALADVPLGSRFDAEVAQEPTEDPIEALEPSSPPPPIAASYTWAF